MTKQEHDSCINGFGNLYEETKSLVFQMPVTGSETHQLQGKILDNLKMMQLLFGTLANVFRAESAETEKKS